MNIPSSSLAGLVVLAHGEATQAQRDLFDPRAVATVRYADPAAWTTATAMARALAQAGEPVRAALDRVGVLVITAHGPAEATAAVAQAARDGFSSPLRYPAANPGSLVGVTSILFGLRGPTLLLTVPPARGVPVAFLLAARWLRHHQLPLMALGVCAPAPPEGYLARCLILSPLASEAGMLPLDYERETAWLLATSGSPKE
jgi:hypothetical protein